MVLALMDRAREQGAGWLNLGIVPLSGMPAHRVTAGWAMVEGLAQGFGAAVLGLSGARAFKQQFNPVWRPRYIACSGRLGLFSALVHCGEFVKVRRTLKPGYTHATAESWRKTAKGISHGPRA